MFRAIVGHLVVGGQRGGTLRSPALQASTGMGVLEPNGSRPFGFSRSLSEGCLAKNKLTHFSRRRFDKAPARSGTR